MPAPREIFGTIVGIVPHMPCVHQQFSCARCGSKQTMDTPNVFYTGGRCEECGTETDIRADGCNYMVILTRRR